MNIVIIGADDKIGQEILSNLSENNINIKTVTAVSSYNQNKNKSVSYGIGKTLQTVLIENYLFSSNDLVVFCENSESSNKYVSIVKKSGAIILNYMNNFDLKEDSQFALEWINFKNINKKNVINLPTANSLILSTVISPLSKLGEIKRIVLSTYNSVANTGKKGFNELYSNTKSIYENSATNPSVFEKEITFNIIPKIGEHSDNGMYTEEFNLINQTNNILNKNIPISATSVRVPTFVGESISLNISFEEEIKLDKLILKLKKSHHIEILDKYEEGVFMTPREVSREKNVYISRIRRDMSSFNSFNMWLVGDGTVLSAINIVELIKKIIKQ